METANILDRGSLSLWIFFLSTVPQVKQSCFRRKTLYSLNPEGSVVLLFFEN